MNHHQLAGIIFGASACVFTLAMLLLATMLWDRRRR